MDTDAIFRALSDPTRRAILKMLRPGGLTSGDIAAQFSSTWPTMSRHLAILRDAGLVSAQRNGNSIRYGLNIAVLEQVAEHVRAWTFAEVGT